jgi:hypothetical protein
VDAIARLPIRRQLAEIFDKASWFSHSRVSSNFRF